jgi:hypothetical protein
MRVAEENDRSSAWSLVVRVQETLDCGPKVQCQVSTSRLTAILTVTLTAAADLPEKHSNGMRSRSGSARSHHQRRSTSRMSLPDRDTSVLVSEFHLLPRFG